MSQDPRDKPLPPRPHSPKSKSAKNRRPRRLCLFPRRRPEQGGTRREKGYWEAMEDARDDKARNDHKQATNEPGCLTLTQSSDRLVQWNTPKIVPRHRRAYSVTNVTQPRPSSAATGPSTGNGRHRSCTSMSGFQLESSGHGASTNRRVARAPTGKASHPQRGSTSHHGCPREERRQSKAERAQAERITARRERRSLKEVGDYLGVQGVNPLTGEPDHVTPFSSDERSELSVDTRQGHFHIPPNFAPRNASGEERLVGEVRGENSAPQGTSEAVADPQKHRRRADGSQWSSVQEPNLSPIAQSSLSGKWL